jgi:hypothetical protein
VDGPRNDLDSLRQELLETEDTIRTKISDMRIWRLRLGPLVLARQVGSQTVTHLYMVFNTVLFGAGVVMAFLESPVQELGIALIVGAIFSYGSFLSQFWTVLVQNERDIRERIVGNSEVTDVQRLLRDRDTLLNQISRLEDQQRSDQSKNND